MHQPAPLFIIKCHKLLYHRFKWTY